MNLRNIELKYIRGLFGQKRKFENSWPLVESKKRKKRGDIIEI